MAKCEETRYSCDTPPCHSRRIFTEDVLLWRSNRLNSLLQGRPTMSVVTCIQLAPVLVCLWAARVDGQETWMLSEFVVCITWRCTQSCACDRKSHNFRLSSYVVCGSRSSFFIFLCWVLDQLGVVLDVVDRVPLGVVDQVPLVVVDLLVGATIVNDIVSALCLGEVETFGVTLA